MSTKSANLYVRIEPDVKEQAEHILSALGISSSSAINMFYKQIILRRGIPFDVSLPMPDVSAMSREELDREIQKGYDDVLDGRSKPAHEVFDSIRKDYHA